MTSSRDPERHLTVSVEGIEIDGWSSASIESDILTPSDAFTLAHAHDDKAFARLRLDAEMTICVDGIPMLNGFVEERRGDWRGFTVSGKDRVARMVAESAPLDLDFRDQDLASIAAELTQPWFERVVFSNAQNRDIMRGRGHKARGRREPLLNPSTDDRRVAPGASKWEALEELLDRAGYLAWSSADGRALIIAKPDFDQEVQCTFHVTRDGSNCADISYRESNTSRYASIVTVGTGRGDSVNYAANTAHRVGIAKDDPDTFNGVGNHFLRQKRLVMPVEATSVAECQRLAEREYARREAASFSVEIQAWGWGMVIPPAREPTLYAPDIVVGAYSENTPVDGAYYVVARTFHLSRNQEQTSLRCVNLGVEL